MTVLDWLKTQKIKYRLSGDEAEIGCPFDTCPNFQEPQFYINTRSEKWNCKRCLVGGVNLKQLEFKLGLVNLREPVRSHTYIPEQEVRKMMEDLFKNEEAVSYLTLKRGLKDSTIRQFKLGYVAKEKFKTYEGPAIFFPDFYKGACIGGEYHFFKKEDRENKKIKENTRSQFYNLERIDLKQPVILTEGRYDAISAWQYGYTNVGSVPNGNTSADGEWTSEISEANKFLIASDNDTPGYQCAQKFAKKVGASKCHRVYLELKDISDYLQHGVPKENLDKVFKDAEPMFTPPVSSISQYMDQAIQIIQDPESAEGIKTEWSNLNEVIKGIRMGELTTSSGNTGQGKTTFALALVGHLIRQGVKCLIVSPEMREQDLLLELASNFRNDRITTPEELEDFINQYQEYVYIAKVFDSWTNKKASTLTDTLFDVIQYSVENKGVQFVVLDHLRLFLNPKSPEGERFEIDHFLRQCVHTLIANKIHIWLIAQPRKGNDAQSLCSKCQKPVWKKMTKNDLKGSSNIEQDSNNIIIIHRFSKKYCNCKYKMDERLVEIEIAKNRKFGAEDSVMLEFNIISKSNYREVKL